MKNYRSSCIICNSGEALCEVFHNETSISKKSKHIFESKIAKAVDNNEYILANTNMEYDMENECDILLDYDEPATDLLKRVMSRSSTREFRDCKVNYRKFSTLLRYSYGKSNSESYTIPSAGGHFPLKLIVIVNNVEDLASGIYEYLHENSRLRPLKLDIGNTIYKNVTISQTLCYTSAFSIHFLGCLELMCYKYSDRGYRFMNIECGHLAQNISLICEELNLGSVCSGGFLDGELITYLNSITNKRFNNYVYLYEMYFGEKL